MELSIVIPLYNTDVPQFKKCVESIYMIEGISFELIIINDGSHEDLSRDYENFLSQYCNVVYKKISNSGVSNARNQGILISKGEYILFVDSDDTIDYDVINNQVINRDLLGKYDLVCGDSFSCNGENLNLKRELSFPKCGEFSYRDVLRDMFYNDNFLAPFAKFIRKSFILEHNLFFDTDFIQGEDALFNMCLLNCKPTIFYLNKPIYFYYFVPSNYDNRWKKNHSILLDNFLEKYKIGRKIILSNSLQEELDKIVIEKAVRHIFRMALVNQSSDTKRVKDFSNYIKLFQIDKRLLSLKGVLMYKILENSNTLVLSLVSKIRKIYINLKY